MKCPATTTWKKYLDAYIAVAVSPANTDRPLFRTSGRKTGRPHPLRQSEAHAMIERRSHAADIKTRIANHTSRATGVTVYMSNGGSLEHAQQIAGHLSPRTRKLYDRRNDAITLDEVERIVL